VVGIRHVGIGESDESLGVGSSCDTLGVDFTDCRWKTVQWKNYLINSIRLARVNQNLLTIAWQLPNQAVI
jgi:hypothetical protein